MSCNRIAGEVEVRILNVFNVRIYSYKKTSPCLVYVKIRIRQIEKECSLNGKIHSNGLQILHSKPLSYWYLSLNHANRDDLSPILYT